MHNISYCFLILKDCGIINFSYPCQSRKENPQKLTQLSSRFHPRHLVGKRTAQKDITIDTTSDSQVNNNFPNRWSPASLTFNNYFYLFLYLYITLITTNNNAPHLKSPKNQNRIYFKDLVLCCILINLFLQVIYLFVKLSQGTYMHVNMRLYWITCTQF